MSSEAPAVSVQGNAQTTPKPNGLVEVKLSGKKRRLIRMVKGAAGIKSNPPKPFLPSNSLSIVERYFHRMNDKSAQVCESLY